MDLTQSVAYRLAQLNDARLDNQSIIGTQINAVNISPVQATGFTEKRAQGDGSDASDVYLGSREVRIEAQTSGATRADLFDRLWVILKALSPTVGFQGNASTKGYEPLSFRVPTANAAYSADGDGNRWIDLFLRCRPKEPPAYFLNRDRIGGLLGKPASILWNATMEAIDPSLYVSPAQIVAFGPSAALVTSGTGTFAHRGTYVTSLGFTIVVPASSGAMVFDLVVAGSHMTVTIANSAAAQTIRWSSLSKTLTREAAAVETLRMDLATFFNVVTYPIVQAGGSAFTWSLTGAGVPGNTSSFSYNEAYV